MEALIQNCRLFYRFEKDETANTPVILFLHGWGCDGTIFSFFEKNSRSSKLIVDFPGHGQSGEPPIPWGVPEYAEQIRELLAQLNISKVRIIAHSFGGRVAIFLASQHPELIEKMVITGGAGIRKPASAQQSKRQKQFQRYKKILLLVGKLKPFKRIVDVLMKKLREKFGSADYVRLNENMRATFVKVISQDLSHMLSAIQSPTLLIWGSADTETPLWMGQQMEKEIPDAGLIVFEGRTHFAFVEESQRFLTIVKKFFGEDELV